MELIPKPARRAMPIVGAALILFAVLLFVAGMYTGMYAALLDTNWHALRQQSNGQAIPPSAAPSWSTLAGVLLGTAIGLLVTGLALLTIYALRLARRPSLS